MSNRFEESIDFWRLCDEFNIVQAALLIVGGDASSAKDVEDWKLDDRPQGYEAAKTAICGGLKNFDRYEKKYGEVDVDGFPLETEDSTQLDIDQELDARRLSLLSRSIRGELIMVYKMDVRSDDMGLANGIIDLDKSTVNAQSLKEWLGLKGFRTGFFFPEPAETMDFLDPTHLRYAPKLVAAVRAWQAVTHPGKKSAKQALDKWLREHATEFGLTNDDGKPIEQAIEECSKVANWKPKGGVNKTPS